MKMARIVAPRGRIGIRFSNGQTKWSNMRIRRGMTEATIRARIGSAKRIIIFDLKMAGNTAMAKEASAISASSSAARIYRQYSGKPAARRAARPATRPSRRRRRARRTGRRRRRPTRRVRARKTPTITASWMDGLLKNSVRGSNYRAKRAASTAHSSRLFVDQFLSRAKQRGVARTANQKAATVAIFNMLRNTSPQFKLLLSSLAAQQHGMAASSRNFPEFIALQSFLSQGKDLAKATPTVMRGADMYIRYFLFSFAANNTNYTRLRTEMNQLPAAALRMRDIRSLSAAMGRATGARRSQLLSYLKNQLSGPMDADTLTASLLYLRRWTLEHPRRGRGKSQKRIEIWKAPAEIPLPKTARVVPRQLPRIRTPVIGAIGDSITAGGRYSRTLQRMLRKKYRGSRVSHYGVVGQDIERIAARFKRDIISNRLRFNTVIIQGGINNIANIPVNRTIAAYVSMIRAARAKGMKVILLGITPWAEWSGSNQTTQSRTIILNRYMKRFFPRKFPGLVFVDMSALGEPIKSRSMVLKLKKEYDSGDHLHPNDAGRDLMAQLIARAAYNIALTPTSAKAILKRYAAKHWRHLKDRIFIAVKANRPAEVLNISKSLPSGWKSFKLALKSLNRGDINRAYDRVFNELLKKDRDFQEYCKSSKRTRGIARASTTLSPTSRPRDRRHIVTTIKRYINHRAKQKDSLNTKLKEDLKGLYRKLKLGRYRLPASPTEDMKTLAAVAVYRWRLANPKANAGAWDKQQLRTVPRRTSPPSRRTPRPARPVPEERDRRINI